MTVNSHGRGFVFHQLGAQLMRRTTRRLSLTDEGRAYLEQARAAFSMIDDAERAIQGATTSFALECRFPTQASRPVQEVVK